MHPHPTPRATGHVRVEQRKRDGAVWYARIRRPDGTQVNRKLGPTWTGRGRPAAGTYTEQTANQALLILMNEIESEAGKPKPPAVSFRDAAVEWLWFSEHDRQVRASTLRDYKTTAATLRDHFGDDTPLTSITAQDVEDYKAGLIDAKKLGARSVNRHLVILGGIFRRAERKWGLRHNPAGTVQRQRERYGGQINFLTPADVRALVKATLDAQDRALFLVAALTGLRQGELLALRWQDADFTLQRIHVRRSYDHVSKQAQAPKSGKVRSVPMVDEVIVALDALSQRERFTGPDDLVFSTWDGDVQYHGDLRARFYAALRAASLKRIRFHDLRHTFGTLAAQKLPIRTVQEYMGHAHISTTLIYSHYAPAGDEAALLGRAFREACPTAAEAAVSSAITA